MKAYTDLNQFKKLAEILPIETADMRYAPFGDTHPWFKEGDLIEKDSIPCWSLAALFEVINQVKEINHQRVTILVGKFAGNHWYAEFVKVQDEKTVLFEHSKELVDACYEMILKLHELNLL